MLEVGSVGSRGSTSHIHNMRRCIGGRTCLCLLLSLCGADRAAWAFSVRGPVNKAKRSELLSEDPRVFVVHDVLSPEECGEYIAMADAADGGRMRRSNAPAVSVKLDRLWPLLFLGLATGIPPFVRLAEQQSAATADDIMRAVLPNIGIAFAIGCILVLAVRQGVQMYADKSTRTSQSLALNTPNDVDFIMPLVERASDITNHSWERWEAPVITKYDEGSLFASHNDASPTRGSEWDDLGGQRVVTVITYLNTCERGGGTKFDQLGLTVQPRQGSALVFYPADDTTLEADGRTVHQSLEAIDEKYIVQLFGRVNRVPAPLGIADEYAKRLGNKAI